MQLRKYLLGELLHLANSSTPWWNDEFYRLKDHVLTMYGTWEGVHLQHIVKECFNCEGTGKIITTEYVVGFPVAISGGRVCAKCNGTGKYHEFWTVLKYYRLGDQHFHIPNGVRYYSRGNVPDLQFDQEIEGYIRHESPKYYLYAEAALWLALIFDHKLFWKRFGRTGYSSHKFTPLVILSTWIFDLSRIPNDVHHFFRRIRERIVNFKQDHCQHEFPESEEPSMWDECRKCNMERLYAEEGRDAVPF